MFESSAIAVRKPTIFRRIQAQPVSEPYTGMPSGNRLGRQRALPPDFNCTKKSHDFTRAKKAPLSCAL
jgi:hypothetical protein